MKLVAITRAFVLLISSLILGCATNKEVVPPPLLHGGRGMEGDLRRVDTIQVGDMAPDFRLKTLDGKRTVHLRSHLGQRPVVLVFGSYT